MKIMYIQYAGDFAEAYDRLIINGGKENYYGQKYSVEAVVQQARRGITVMVLILKSPRHRLELEKNLITVGLDIKHNDFAPIKKEIYAFSPDAAILRMPDVEILRYLRKKNIRTLPVFADSFEHTSSVRGRLNNFLLSRELRSKSIDWIANHQVNASISIMKLGISPKKILPYDWEHQDTPENWQKHIPENISTKEISLFFAGMLVKEKGIYDLIESSLHLKQNGRKVNIKIAGKGETDNINAYVSKLGITENIELLGLIDHDEVLKNMNQADFVVVPSHHSYAEGLPMTIMESLMVHTPVIASDHPMFVGRVGKRGAVLFFREKNAKDLCDTILSACASQQQYAKMCENAPHEWHDLTLPLKWADMINTWINNPNFDFIDNSIYSMIPPANQLSSHPASST